MARVLVVDDDALQRAAMVSTLAKSGYTVVQATAGAEALRRVLDEPPDVIVLDLRLPDLHGVQVAGAIRAVAPTRRMPIVVVTAFPEEVARLDPKLFGAECVLEKPVEESLLRDAVARCLVSPVDETTQEF